MPFRSIEDPTKLRRVLEATLLIESNLELPDVLRHVVEEACSMTGARYGALGVLDEEKQALSDFITVGLSEEMETSIGERPTGRGVLGLLIADPKALRINEIGGHPDSFGFPPGHPPMTSFLGVPIKVRDEVYGNLYLADKIGWSEFTHDDEELASALSLSAGIAIENARLHDRVRRSAVYEDRDRVARDLHDTVIQRLFALGLTLQGMAARLPAATAAQLGNAVGEIDRVIAEVRSTIYELGMGDDSRGVRDDITNLTRELAASRRLRGRRDLRGPARRCHGRAPPGAPARDHPGSLDQRWAACPGDPCLAAGHGARRVVLPDHHRQRGGDHAERPRRRAAVSGSRTCAGARRSFTAPSPSPTRPEAAPS